MKVKTSYVPLQVNYLTVDKVYEVMEEDTDGFGYIINDKGRKSFIAIHCSSHLGGKDWEIVE